jgi:hypothetical protein
MIKTTLAIALLLGYTSALTTREGDSSAHTSDADAPSSYIERGPDVLVRNETSTTYYNVSSTTIKDLETITEFWTNKTNGTHCISLFEKYYNLTLEIQSLVEEANKTILEYNADCKEKCFPGYYICNATDTCLTPEDCCEVTHPGYTWCTSGTPAFEECVPECCDNNEVYCNNTCVKIKDLPDGYLPVPGETPHDSDTCCFEQGCCTVANT